MSAFTMYVDSEDIIQVYTNDEVCSRPEGDVEIILVIDDKVNEISSFLTLQEAKMLGERLVGGGK